MANIFTMIEKETVKGNVLIDRKGNFISLEKVETMAKKSYIQDLKSGSVSFEKSFEEYRQEIIESGYIPASVLVSDFQYLVGMKLESPEMPEPAMSENVAN